MASVNVETSLWPDRWPAIALQECIDEVEAAPPEEQAKVKWNLPCATCPENTRCLNARRKELGPLLYDREIMTSPRTSESSLFPRELFEPLLRRDMTCVKHYRKPFGVESQYRVVSAWDLAWSEKTGGDWMVKFTVRLNMQNGLRTVLDIHRTRQLSFDQQCQLIEAHHGRYRDDIVVIEADAAQMIWSQHLSAQTAVPVVRHTAGKKKDLSQGVPMLLIELENAKWRIPFQQGSYHHENIRQWLAECESFGWEDDRLQGVGEHDDTVLAWYHAAWGCKRLLGQGIDPERHRDVVPGARL